MAEIANSSWYRQGTVSITDGSTKVTGTDTHFTTAGINPGATFRIDGRPYAYEVASVVSDTEIQLARAYYGGTVSKAAYSIDRNFQSTTNANLAQRVTSLLGIYEDIRDGVYLTIEGKSAYQVAVKNGYTGTEAQWLESLKAAEEFSALKNLVDPLLVHNAGAHNAMYRGKNLGVFSDAQSAAIRAGTFGGTYGGIYADVYPGDYWIFSNVPYTYYDETSDATAQTGKTYYADATGTELETQPETGADISESEYFEQKNAKYSGTMRVADLDYYYRFGYGRLRAHHVVVVPDTPMFNAPMNATTTTEGGYVGSKMRTVHLKRAEAIFKACFGENHVLTHSEYLINAVKNGRASTGAWCNSVVELMDERMMYGATQFDSATPDGSGNPFSNAFDMGSITHGQLNLFRHRPEMISNEGDFWQRNVVFTGWFTDIKVNGMCGYCYASCPLGVRPYALIY